MKRAPCPRHWPPPKFNALGCIGDGCGEESGDVIVGEAAGDVRGEADGCAKESGDARGEVDPDSGGEHAECEVCEILTPIKSAIADFWGESGMASTNAPAWNSSSISVLHWCEPSE